MKKHTTLAGLLVLASFVLAPWASAQDWITANKVTASGNTDGSHSALLAVDDQTSTTWKLASGATAGWLELDWTTPQLIAGVDWQGSLPTGAKAQLWYQQGGTWKPFLAGILDAGPSTGWVDLSLDDAVATGLQWRVSGAGAASATLAELTVKGSPVAGLSRKMNPVSVSASDNTLWSQDEMNLVDGDTRTSWRLDGLAGDDNDEKDTRDWLKSHQNRKRFTPAFGEGAVVLDYGRPLALDLVKLYLPVTSESDIIVEAQTGTNWTRLGTLIKGTAAGWQRLGVAGMNLTTAQIRLRASVGPWGAVQVAEAEVWGRSDSVLRSPQSLLSAPVDLTTAANVSFTSDGTTTQNVQLVVQGGSPGSLPVEVNNKPYTATKTTVLRGRSVYSLSLSDGTLWTGENYLKVKALPGLVLEDVQAAAATSDGRLAAGPTGEGESLWTLGGLVSVERLAVEGVNPATVSAWAKVGAGWVALNNLDGAGVVTDQLKLSIVGQPGAVRLWGSRVTAAAPVVRVLTPTEEDGWTGDLGSKLIGWVTSGTTKVFVNQVQAKLKGNFYWVKIADLKLIAGEENLVTVTATDGQNRQGTKVVHLVANAGDQLTLNQAELTYTQGATVVISGQTSSTDGSISVGALDVPFVNKKFSTTVNLAEGLNVITVQWLKTGGKVKAALVRRVIRNSQTLSLTVDSPSAGTVTSQSTVDVVGRVRGVGAVSVTVNGKTAVVVDGNFSCSALALTEGDNSITVKAQDSAGQTQTVTLKVTRDTKAPVIGAITPNGGYVTTTLVNVSVAVSDAGPVWVKLGPGDWTQAVGGSVQQTVPMGEGPNTLTISAQDAAGNTSSATTSVTVDVSLPAAFSVNANVGALTNNTRPTLSFSTTDAVSGIDHYQAVLDNASAVTVTSPWQLPVLADGNHVVVVTAFDKAGLSTSASISFSVDSTAPMQLPAPNVVPSKDSMSVSWTAASETNVTYWLERSPAWTGGAMPLPQTGYVDAGLAQASEYQYRVWAQDGAGNVGPASAWAAAQTGKEVAPVVADQPSVAEYADVKLEAPAGAFDAAVTQVTIHEIAPEALPAPPVNPSASAIYEFQVTREGSTETSEHAELETPVTLTMGYDPAKIPAGYTEADLKPFYFDTVWGRWLPLEGARIDTQSREVKFETTHFSPYNLQATQAVELSPQQLRDVQFSPLGTNKTHSPVSVSPQGGSVSTDFTELVLPGRTGLDLVVKRVWDSGTAQSDAGTTDDGTDGSKVWSLGPGWRLNFPNMKWNSGGLWVTGLDGQVLSFGQAVMKGSSTSGNVVTVTMESHEYADVRVVLRFTPNTFLGITFGYSFTDATLVMKDGRTVLFNSDGTVKTISDSTGTNSIGFKYNAGDRVITDSRGRTVTVTWDSAKKRISKIDASAGGDNYPTITYTYNTLGLLTTAVDVGTRSWNYEYTPEDLILSKMTVPSIDLPPNHEVTSTSKSLITPPDAKSVKVQALSKVTGPGMGITNIVYTPVTTSYSTTEKGSYQTWEGDVYKDLQYQVLDQNGNKVYNSDGTPKTVTVKTLVHDHHYVDATYHLQYDSDRLVGTTVTSSLYTGPAVRSVSYGYNFVEGDGHQFYNKTSTVDDGRVLTTTNYNTVTKTRNRLSQAPDAVRSGLSGFGVGSADPEVVAYFGSQSQASKATGKTLETLTQEWDTGAMRMTATTTSRDVDPQNPVTNLTRTDYVYDSWGNVTSQETNSQVGQRKSKTSQQRSYYLVGAASNLGLGWAGVSLSPPTTEYGRWDLTAAVKTTDWAWKTLDSTDMPTQRQGFVYYLYNSSGQLTEQDQATDAGWAKTSYEYDNIWKEVSKVVTPQGTTTYTYEDPDAVNPTIAHPKQYLVTTVVQAVVQGDASIAAADVTTYAAYNQLTGTLAWAQDGRGNVTSKIYDNLDRPTEIDYPKDADETAAPKTNVQYFLNPLKSQVTDAKGGVATYTFDALGRLIQVDKTNSYKDRSGTDKSETITTKLEYDAWDDVHYMRGPLSDLQDKDLSFTTEFTYDERGRVKTTTSPGATIPKNFIYDDLTNTVTTEDEEDQFTTQTLDWQGKVIRQSATVAGVEQVTITYYDGAGRPVRTVDPLGHTTDTDYNLQGLAATITGTVRTVWENGSPAAVAPVVTKTYDQAGQLATVSQALGGTKTRTTTYTYNSAGALIGTSTPVTVDGATKTLETHITYDANGNKTVETSGYKGEDQHSQKWEYNARGLVKTETDQNNSVTTYTYDKVGNRKTVTDSTRNYTMTLTYDQVGRLILGELPALGGNSKPTISFTYDGRGHLLQRVDPNNQTTGYHYNAKNQLDEQTAPDGTKTKLGYDQIGRQTSVTSPSGVVVSTTYDELGRVLTQGNATQGFTTLTYDAAGNKLSAQDGKGNTSYYTYTPDHQVATVIDANLGQTSVQYDRWSQKTQIIDAEQNVRTYTYDEIGRMIGETTPQKFSLKSSYDAWGDVVSQTDANGTTFAREYNGTGHLTKETATNGTNSQVTTYNYDSAGDLIDSDNGIKTQYNLVGSSYQSSAYGLTTGKKQVVNGVPLTLGYSYDASQRLLEASLPDAAKLTYGYNDKAQLATLTNWINGNINYDGNGRMTGYKLGNNVTKTVSYDDQDRLDILSYKAGTTDLKSYDYGYDLAGNIDSKNANTYEYDALNRLIGANEKGWFQQKPDALNPSYGIAERDYTGLAVQSYYVQPTDTVTLDMAKRSLLIDLGQTLGVNKIELHPQNTTHRVRERDLTVWGDNTKITVVKFTANPDGSITLEFPKIFEARVIRIHTIWDDRNIANVSIATKATFANTAKELVKVWALKKTHVENYGYDNLGDRTYQNIDNSTAQSNTYYTNDAGGNLSLIKNDGTWDYTYDNNGNRLTKTKIGESWSYTWGLHNELLNVAKNGVQIVSYTYDASLYRVSRTGSDGTTVYAYGRGGALVYQKNINKNESRTFAYVGGQIIGWTDTAANGTKTTYYAVTDLLGSVTAVTDSTAKTVWSSEYTPFGTLAGVEGSYVYNGGFTGQDIDADTGLEYHHYRWYDHDSGAFVSSDPAMQGTSYYAYGNSSPLNFTDPTGLAGAAVAHNDGVTPPSPIIGTTPLNSSPGPTIPSQAELEAKAINTLVSAAQALGNGHVSLKELMTTNQELYKAIYVALSGAGDTTLAELNGDAGGGSRLKNFLGLSQSATLDGTSVNSKDLIDIAVAAPSIYVTARKNTQAAFDTLMLATDVAGGAGLAVGVFKLGVFIAGKIALKAATRKAVEEGMEQAASKGTTIADDAFVRFDAAAFDKSIESNGILQRYFRDKKVWLTQYKYVKGITDPKALETMLYRQNLWSDVAGRFDSGATLRLVGNAEGAVPAGVTNMVNGIPQWRLLRDIAASDLTKIVTIGR